MQYNYQHFGVPRIDYVDSSHDRVWGWADPGATVDVHVHGIVRQNVIADGSGRWSQHIGQERGNARIEVRQMKTGRPWSGMAVSNVVQLPALRKSKYRSNEYSTRPYLWLGKCMGNSKGTCTWCVYS